MKIAPLLSAKFSNFGFLAVCLVVTMHVHCPWEGGGINRLAVPFFFLMSGYFLAGHVGEAGWHGAAVRKRVRTLLVPLLVWCVLWAVYSISMGALANVRAGRPLFSHVMTGLESLRYLALDPTHTPALGPLWYVRCLFFFVCASAAFVGLVRRLGATALVLPALLYAAHVGYCRAYGQIDFLTFGFSLCGFFYFAAGMTLRMKKATLEIGRATGALALALGLVLYCSGFTEISIPFLIIGLWGLMPARPLPKMLTDNTFPIYLIHMFVLLLFGAGKVNSPALALGIGIAAIVLSLFVALALRKLFPRLTPILFGGR